MTATSWHVSARRCAITAAIYCAMVVALLGLNAIAGRKSDPLAAPRLTHLQLELNRNPKDIKLRSEIRRIDSQIRTDYFRHRDFAVRGFYLLLGGVAVFLLSTEIARLTKPRLPEPQPQASEDAFTARALGQRGVFISGVFLLGFLATVAVFSRRDSSAEYAKLALQPSDNSPVKELNNLTKSQVTVVPTLAAPQVPSLTATPPVSTALTPPLPSPQLAPFPIAQSPSPTPLQVIKPLIQKAFIRPQTQKKSVAATPTAPLSSIPKLLSLTPYTADDSVQQWPFFRGPRGDGHAEGKAPLKWDTKSGQGILWKSEVPLEGWNSPIVWGEKVLLSGATKTSRAIYCYAARDGSLLWKCDIPISSTRELKLSPETGFAPSTLATDGKFIGAVFVNGDVLCLDFEGKIVWQRALGTPDNQYGHASSLVIFNNALIVQWDQGDGKDNKSALYALELSTGKTIWKTLRPVSNSWATPLLAKSGSKVEVLTCSTPFIIAYDALSGVETWRIECLSGDVAPSPVLGEKYIIACSPYSELMTVAPGKQAKVVWKTSESAPDIVSPAAHNGLVFSVSEAYVVAFDENKGTVAWTHQFKEVFHASPVIAENRVYLLDSKGNMQVFDATRQFKLLAENSIGEECGASPAIVAGRIYIRGKKNLFCIGDLQ